MHVRLLWGHNAFCTTGHVSCILFWLRYIESPMYLTHWSRKERFETGWKFFNFSHSSMAFFRSGKIKALFNSGEKPASSGEVLTIRVSTGVSSPRQSLKMDTGVESREYDLLGEDGMIFRTSSWQFSSVHFIDTRKSLQTYESCMQHTKTSKWLQTYSHSAYY